MRTAVQAVHGLFLVLATVAATHSTWDAGHAAVDATTMAANRFAMQAPLVTKALGKHTATVIMLHGLGDSGHGWADIADMFRGSLPHVKWIFPHAPARPITLNGGFVMPGWYDITSLTDRDEQNCEGMHESAAFVRDLVAKEAEAGVPSTRVVVAGFSQGAVLSLYTALTSDTKFAGIAALSGYLALWHELTPEAVRGRPNLSTPIFMAHGDADPVVAHKWGEQSAARLRELGCNVDFRTYRGLGHSAAPQELEDLRAFIAKVLPPQ